MRLNTDLNSDYTTDIFFQVHINELKVAIKGSTEVSAEAELLFNLLPFSV